jgi:light-regulated signal transduction histidine kinase (bacteriophytochrome)
MGNFALMRKQGMISSIYLDNIADSAHRMGRLVDDLLTFSRTGRAEMQVKRVELDELVQEVRQELAPDMKDRHITWEIGSLTSVQADPILLYQGVGQPALQRDQVHRPATQSPHRDRDCAREIGGLGGDFVRVGQRRRF